MKIISTLLLVCIVCLSISHEMTLKSQSSNTPHNEAYEKELYRWSKTMAEAFHVVQERYHDAVDVGKAMVKAINAFVSADPHSNCLDPKSYQDILQTTHGEFCGIGVVIHSLKEPEDEAVLILDTLPGGPADTAGLKAGDKIVQVNDELVKGMTLDEAITKLKGKKGSTVNVKLMRGTPPQLLSLTITRDVVKEQNVVGYYFDQHNIDYLALTTFSGNSAKQVEQVLQKGEGHKAKGIILDLRNNTGGTVDSVIEIAGLFLPKGSLIVKTKNGKKEVLSEYKTMRTPVYRYDAPIFILINNFTASAAEILAGTLKIHAKELARNGAHNQKKLQVFIVGTDSFGKGSVQELIPISNDCALKLTIGLYYFSDDSCLQKTGIVPDFEIKPKLPPTQEMTWIAETVGREHALKNALKVSAEKEGEQQKKTDQKKEEPEKTWKERRQEQISSDYQILSTIRLIETYDMAKKAYPAAVKTRDETIQFLKKTLNLDEKLSMKEIQL